MKKTKEQKQAERKLLAAYNKGGSLAVFALWKKAYSHLGKWKRCEPCEEETPHIHNTCQVCWTENEPKTKAPIHVPGFRIPIPNMKNKAIAKEVKAFIKEQKAKALIKELKAVVKELRKDSKRKQAEIEAFKKRLHSKKGA